MFSVPLGEVGDQVLRVVCREFGFAAPIHGVEPRRERGLSGEQAFQLGTVALVEGGHEVGHQPYHLPRTTACGHASIAVGYRDTIQRRVGPRER